MAKIMGLAFTPDGKFIVSAGHDKVIRLWDWRAGKTVDDLGSAWASAPTRSLACITRVLSRRETADELLYTGQDGLLIAREGPVVGAVELDKSRLRDVASEMAAGADANSAVAATVEHQGRRRNSAQKMPHIGIAQRLEQALEGSRARRPRGGVRRWPDLRRAGDCG